MGTDIHFFVERKVEGQWVSCDQWEEEDYKGKKFLSPVYEASFYTGRNYSLFAILANVRNGRGFAGIKTGEGFNPIAMPRGFPEDMSAELTRHINEGYEHTPSWLLLSEVLAYDWTQTTQLQGWVSALEFFKWNRWARKNGEGPNRYAGDVSGSGIEKITLEAMEQRLAALDLGSTNSWNEEESRIAEALPGVYCLATWELPYYKCARNFWSDTIPRLLRLGQPDAVRMVFYFDS